MIVKSDPLSHHGIKGQQWGVRRYQNPDGTRTEAGLRRDAKRDEKWAKTKGEKIKAKTMKKVSKDMTKYVNDELNVKYTKSGKLSSETILAYNNRLSQLMNSEVGDIPSPSGKVLRFVAKRGELGVHTALADSGYDMAQLDRGVFESGKVAYKNKNLRKEDENG